jgi:hypothetical protein
LAIRFGTPNSSLLVKLLTEFRARPDQTGSGPNAFDGEITMPQHQLAHSVQGRISNAEWQMRVELAAAYRSGARALRLMADSSLVPANTTT